MTIWAPSTYLRYQNNKDWSRKNKDYHLTMHSDSRQYIFYKKKFYETYFLKFYKSLYASMFPMPRVVYSLASDGLIFRFLSYIMPRLKTPVAAALTSGLFAGLTLFQTRIHVKKTKIIRSIINRCFVSYVWPRAVDRHDVNRHVDGLQRGGDLRAYTAIQTDCRQPWLNQSQTPEWHIHSQFAFETGQILFRVFLPHGQHPHSFSWSAENIFCLV